MKMKRLFTLVLSLMMILSLSAPASAIDGENVYTKEEISSINEVNVAKYAKSFVETIDSTADVTAGNVLTMYSENENISGYCVDILEDGYPNGYVVVKFSDNDPVVSEFSLGENIRNPYAKIMERANIETDAAIFYSVGSNDYQVLDTSRNVIALDNSTELVSEKEFAVYKSAEKAMKQAAVQTRSGADDGLNYSDLDGWSVVSDSYEGSVKNGKEHTITGAGIVFVNEDLKQTYNNLFGEALEAYNAGKKKTRDKIPDYYEHIRQSKQEKLFHEAIFQIGNLTDCGCGSPGGERAAAALKEFAESFQERNPHLRVFNMVLHMDEATPHLHVDFVPVATEQSRGLSTRVSMKQALKQQGFEGLGRKQTEWKAWMEREKEALTEIAQAHEFEIISLGGGRERMELPEYRAAAQRLEAIQEQVTAAEQEIAALEKQRKALQGNVKLLKAVEKVKPDLDAIQPEKTLTGAVKGVTVEQVKELKAAVIRGAAAEQKVRELKVENQQLQQKIPSMKEKLKEAQERQRLENENRQLKVQVEYLEEDLSWERGISARLREGIGAVLDFLDQHLPEQFRPLVEKARELLPVPEVQQPEREQEQGHTWGGMEL